jgi:hypothetical protein
MELNQFAKTVDAASPPSGYSIYLKALWYDAIGDWKNAHDLIDDLKDKDAAWVHAYLHRKEGDVFNADYWYKKAGKLRPDYSLQHEWEILVSYFN